ncbi:PF20097 family protein [Dethiothermospora halolimnae]|uniref:PF20097 family protein n=1 Tax=Dethiothermospora halolimnae TaxID=3114390 RepID=UPI003CCBD4E5
MNCPYCGIEMTIGMIEGDGRMSLIWREYGEKIGWLDRVLKKKNVIAEAHVFGKSAVGAYKCEECNKIIIELH